MKLIIGGAYQGKRDYVKEVFGLKDEEIFDCRPGDELDPKAAAYDHYENYVLTCMRKKNREYLNVPEDKVLIFTDIYCGVVPMDTEQRAWREECGRAMTALAKRAESVERIFCGLPEKLK